METAPFSFPGRYFYSHSTLDIICNSPTEVPSNVLADDAKWDEILKEMAIRKKQKVCVSFKFVLISIILEVRKTSTVLIIKHLLSKYEYITMFLQSKENSVQ